MSFNVSIAIEILLYRWNFRANFEAEIEKCRHLSGYFNFFQLQLQSYISISD